MSFTTLLAIGPMSGLLGNAAGINPREEFEYLSKFVDYVKNCGGKISTKSFDDDWSPVGVGIRGRLVSLGMLQYNADGDLSLPPEPLAEPKMAVKVERL